MVKFSTITSLIKEVINAKLRPAGYHHYDECVSCLSGDICNNSTAHPSYWGLLGTTEYTYEEFSRDCERW